MPSINNSVDRSGFRRGPTFFRNSDIIQDVPLAAAARIFDDVAGLSRFLVHADGHDVLHDDGKRIAERAIEAGVDARFKTLPGRIHGIQYWCHTVPEGLASIAAAGAFLRRYV